MAQIDAVHSLNKRKRKSIVTRKLSTRVDLTPMVDLAFLLITFFIFTTALSQPSAMQLILPEDKGDSMLTKESGALTLIPDDNRVFYYEEKPVQANLHSTSLKDLREIIISKKNQAGDNDLFIIIKPTKTSSYGDMVNVLDEMIINDVKRYALNDISNYEEELLK